MKGARQLGFVQLACNFQALRTAPFSVSIRRNIHDVAVSTRFGEDSYHKSQPPGEMAPAKRSPLSVLPLATLIRSFLITSVSSYPPLLTPSLKVLSRLGRSSSPFLNPDRNPVLHYLLKKTFYAQFCAGETPHEVRRTIRGLKQLGFRGVILSHGKEIVLERGQSLALPAENKPLDFEESKEEKEHIAAWRNGIMKTVEMMEEGDYAAIKMSGAGSAATRHLIRGLEPSPSLKIAIYDVCDLAKKTGVRLMIDAEQHRLQDGIHQWTLALQRKYNKGQALIFDTYQTYLRSAPKKLAAHLQCASRDGFVLGVKLVRGAYMSSDPAEIFWESKSRTDQVFDGITEALLRRRWNGSLQTAEDNVDMAPVEVVLASHNQESVRKALAIQAEREAAGKAIVKTAYGQLMGMADEISCDLLLMNKKGGPLDHQADTSEDGPSAYKYLTWGSVQECLKYLVRRAEENKHAMVRARHTRTELGRELLRRVRLLNF